MSHNRFAFGVLALALLAGCAAPGGRSTRGPSAEEAAAAVQVRMGQEYMSKGDLETAQDKLRRAVELDPSSVDAYTLLALLNERINRPEIAEKHYLKAIALKPEDGAVNNNYGTFLCGLGRFDDAEVHFQRALNDPFYKTPGTASANAGVCANKAGRAEAAEKYFRRTLELDPSNLAALYEMASIAFKRGEFLRARAFIQRYEARGRVDAELLILAIRVESRLGAKQAEQEYRERLRNEFPDVEFPAERTTESP